MSNTLPSPSQPSPTEPPSDAPAPSIPKVVLISTIAALAFTTGLTLTVLPSLRNRRRSTTKTFQFLSNHHLSTPPPNRPLPELIRSRAPVPVAVRKDAVVVDISDSKVGEEEGGEPLSPLFGIGALGIATAIVLGTASVVSIATFRILGVQDMEEFSTKMRSLTTQLLPTSQHKIYKPSEPPIYPSHVYEGEEDTIVGTWFEGVVRMAEREREEVIREKGLAGEGGRGKGVTRLDG